MQRIEKSAEQADGTERNAPHRRADRGQRNRGSHHHSRRLDVGAEREVETGGRRKNAVRLAADGVVLFTGSEGTERRADLS